MHRAQARGVTPIRTHFRYKFYFKMHSKLRLNITLTQEHLYPFWKGCSYQSLKIATLPYLPSSSNNEIYCGLLSNFVSVPGKPSVQLEVMVHRQESAYHVDFTFIATDPGRVVSYVIKHRWNLKKLSDMIVYYHETGGVIRHIQNSKEPSDMIVYFPETATFFYRFTVNVEFFQIIKFTLLSKMKRLIDIYDGPGILCSKVIPSSNTNVKVTYITSSFQSMIDLKSCRFPNATNIKYVSYENIVSKHITLTESALKNLSYPMNDCYNTNHVCIIEMKTKPWLYFNMTIKNMYHQFTERMLCNYGGIAVYETLHSTLISKFCYSHPGKYYYQNIYSNTSTAKLIIYSYREYGPFNVTLDVTTTRCQAFTINICNVHSQIFEVNACVIFQLKQGSNQYFEENNVYSNLKFCRLVQNPFDQIKRRHQISVKFIG